MDCLRIGSGETHGPALHHYKFFRLMALCSLLRFHTGLLALLAFAVSGIPHIQDREKPLAWFGWTAEETLTVEREF